MCSYFRGPSPQTLLTCCRAFSATLGFCVSSKSVQLRHCAVVSRPAMRKLRIMSRRNFSCSAAPPCFTASSCMNRPTKLLSSPAAIFCRSSAMMPRAYSFRRPRWSRSSRSQPTPSHLAIFHTGLDQKRQIRICWARSKDRRKGLEGSSREPMSLEKPIRPMVSRVKRFIRLNMSRGSPFAESRMSMTLEVLASTAVQMCVSNCLFVNMRLAVLRWCCQPPPSTLKMPSPRRSVNGSAKTCPFT
mmetsp:Transcript_9705/g.26341  ORF Transcript_9705/g.26341 Transcript_9705/m.26341 type:complete len:244 (-) Transcript_9705:450-1181(-)